VLILARGGGSMEDLWSFNEESSRAPSFASEIPVISGSATEPISPSPIFVADGPRFHTFRRRRLAVQTRREFDKTSPTCAKRWSG